MSVHRLADDLVDFRSDNTGAAAPEIVAALAAANSGTAAGYGHDRWTAELQGRFGELFEAENTTPIWNSGRAASMSSLGGSRRRGSATL